MNDTGFVSKIKTEMKNIFITDEVFWKNEVDANKLLARILVFSALILIVTNALNYVGVYKVPSRFLNTITLQGLLELLIPAGLCFYFKGETEFCSL